MDSSPLPENIEGRVVETHNFDHEVHHSVRWDYLAGIVVVTIVLLLLVRNRSSDSPEGSNDVVEEGDGGGVIG